MRSVCCILSVLGALALAAPVQVQAQSAPRLNYAAMNKLGWKLSSQAWTFRELSLFETIDTLKDLGIRYIEMFPGQRLSKENTAGFDHNAPADVVAQVIEKCKSANVRPIAYGVVGLGGDEAEDRKVFEFAKKLGMTTITTEPGENDFGVIDKLAQEYKIGIAIHDHPKPSHYWNPETVLKVAAGRSKYIGACADTGHWYRSDLVPVDCLKMLKGRITSLHLKDLDTSKEDVPWGTGVCDFDGMLAELKSQGFKGVVSIEYERTSGAELLENVRKCVAAFSDASGRLAKSK